MGGRRRRRLGKSSAISGRGAEASAGVTFGFGRWAAAAVLRLGVGVISVLQTRIPGTDGVAGLRAWRHGGGTRVRGQVLGGRHGHETHPEVPTERSQVSDFANSGRGVVLGGAGRKTLKYEESYVCALPFISTLLFGLQTLSLQ